MPTTQAKSTPAPTWTFVGHYVGRETVVPDWSALGQYQLIADGLAEIARAVIDTAQIKQGEAVLDVGSRCGNWALLAAEAGGKVTGIDFSPGLLEAARAKLKAYPDARFELADVARLPFADASFDVVIDVMTLIFGADRETAVAEMARVLKPGGRIIWSGWLGGDAVAEAAKIQMQDTAAAAGHAAFPYSSWGDEDDMRGLFGAQGFQISMTKHPMVSTAPSPKVLLERIDQVHPVSRACSLALEKAGMLEQTTAKMAEVFERRNEAADLLKISRYFVVGVATRKS
jgi:SAM-dependent methyltransferase